MTDKVLLQLTEEQMDAIAERAANKVFNRIYTEVGKSVIRKIAWLTGLVVVGVAVWLAGKDALPK